MRLRVAGGLVLAALLPLLSCGGGGATGPPPILYGEDICDRCRMVISEERHAAAARVEGREHRFDDPGCLLDFVEAAAAPPDLLWVHDEERAWLAATEAWFVLDPEAGTPMASGILAFRSRQSAADSGERLGSPLWRWSELAEARQGEETAAP